MYGTDDSSRDVVRVHASPLPNKCSVILERLGKWKRKNRLCWTLVPIVLWQ
jgi:hypothetical protein